MNKEALKRKRQKLGAAVSGLILICIAFGLILYSHEAIRSAAAAEQSGEILSGWKERMDQVARQRQYIYPPAIGLIVLGGIFMVYGALPTKPVKPASAPWPNVPGPKQSPGESGDSPNDREKTRFVPRN